jgi:hypothetical protein
MSHLHLRELVEERRKVRVGWLKSSNSLNVMQNKIYSARVIDLDYQIEVLRNALKGSKELIQASCN